ncbi:hypothetical protein GQ457_08G031570 [Hibiscus cannabinus]
MMLPPVGSRVVVTLHGYCAPFGGGIPGCFSAAWSVSVRLGDGGCWLLCHAFRMAEGFSFGEDMVSCLPCFWLLLCDAPSHGGVVRCWPGLARTLPLGVRCCGRLPLGTSPLYFFSRCRVCLCATPVPLVAIRGAWLWPLLELSLCMLQPLGALCFPHLGVGMCWASFAPTFLSPWSIRPGLFARVLVCSFVCASDRLVSPSFAPSFARLTQRDVWCARAARTAAHPAAWLLIVATVVVARDLTGPARDLFQRCPMHGLPEWTQVSIFYNSVNTPTRMMLDASANGTVLDKPPRESLEILDKIAQNDYQHPTTRRGSARRGPAQLDSSDNILAQIASLTNMVKNMQKQPHFQEVKAIDTFCDQCGSNHDASECGQQVESSCYVGNYNRNNISNTYNSAWRNHPNFSWKNQSNTLNPQQPTQPGFQNQPRQNQQTQSRQEFHQPIEYKSLENTLNQFMAQTSAYMARTDRFIQKTDAFMDRTEMKLQNHDATLKSLETQVGQISQLLSSRSGKILKNNLEGTTVNPPVATDTPAQADEDQSIPLPTIRENSAESSTAQSEEPQVHINLPLVEALQQMPNYAKFLKDMVTRKKRIEEFETVAATETFLALMHNKVPAKKTDPGSFTIDCLIGHNYPIKALCDLGASINLMPKSVFQKLGIGEAKPTTVMLQLEDHSYVQPEGKIEDILADQEERLIATLRQHKEALGWTIADIKGISPTICMHKILLDDNHKPTVDAQRRLNQAMKDVVRKEILKWLDAGYNQIAIAPEDQSKTTFTCPYGTFAFRRMPFGLCNAPATFQRCMTAIFSDLNEDFLEIFMDDFSTFGENFDSCLSNL